MLYGGTVVAVSQSDSGRSTGGRNGRPGAPASEPGEDQDRQFPDGSTGPFGGVVGVVTVRRPGAALGRPAQPPGRAVLRPTPGPPILEAADRSEPCRYRPPALSHWAPEAAVRTGMDCRRRGTEPEPNFTAPPPRVSQFSPLRGVRGSAG